MNTFLEISENKLGKENYTSMYVYDSEKIAIMDYLPQMLDITEEAKINGLTLMDIHDIAEKWKCLETDVRIDPQRAKLREDLKAFLEELFTDEKLLKTVIAYKIFKINNKMAISSKKDYWGEYLTYSIERPVIAL